MVGRDPRLHEHHPAIVDDGVHHPASPRAFLTVADPFREESGARFGLSRKAGHQQCVGAEVTARECAVFDGWPAARLVGTGGEPAAPRTPAPASRSARLSPERRGAIPPAMPASMSVGVEHSFDRLGLRR